MSAEEERARATELVELRRGFWRAVLSEPHWLDWVMDRVAAAIDDADAMAELRAARGDTTASDRLHALLVALDRAHALAPAIEAGLASGSYGRAFDIWRTDVRCAYRRLALQRGRFACANLRLVIAVARRSPRSAMLLEDRVQEGNVGLMTAIDRFDPERGFRFSTYAAWWIRHAIGRAIVERERLIRVPTHLHTLYGKSQRIEAALASRLGRLPSPEEVAVALGADPDKLDRARRAMATSSVSIDTGTVDRGEPLADSISDETAPDVGAAMDERRDIAVARDALASLPAREREIVVRRFGLEGGPRVSLQAIGSERGVSRERIRQLQNATLRKLRDAVCE
jgi:RNA polymerase primary sigma factor